MRTAIFLILSSLSFHLPAADVHGGRCFPQTSQEIINFYRQGRCGEQPTGLQPKGLNSKGITIESDRAAVQFDFNSTHIQPEFIAMLNQWGEALKQLSELRFRLEGHADMIGKDSYNYRLSVQRAEKLKDYFVQHFAIEAARFEIAGFGESRPLEGLPASPDEEKRQWNRRVELVKIVEND